MKIFSYLFVFVFILSSCNQQLFMRKSESVSSFDWQGHRGARGLLPENTIPAFLHALTYPAIKTLELDVVITKDNQVIVSHEPWMSATICKLPDGSTITDEQEKALKIIELSLAEVQAFDCGSKVHPRFPEQQKLPTYKPSLREVITAAEAEAERLQRPLPYYNIEIKSLPEWDNVFTPVPETFASLVLSVIQEAGVNTRVTIQSFDPRSLQAVYALAPQQSLAYLIANENTTVDNLALLDFKPAIYSPYYELVTAEMVDFLHQSDIQLIPWTVNDPADMKRLQKMGVDGMITDYPNRIEH